MATSKRVGVRPQDYRDYKAESSKDTEATGNMLKEYSSQPGGPQGAGGYMIPERGPQKVF